MGAQGVLASFPSLRRPFFWPLGLGPSGGWRDGLDFRRGRAVNAAEMPPCGATLDFAARVWHNTGIGAAPKLGLERARPGSVGQSLLAEERIMKTHGFEAFALADHSTPGKRRIAGFTLVELL